MRLFMAGASLALLGCWSTSFHASEANFQSTPALGDPAVYMSRMPDEPFRSLGIIEVEGPGSTSIDEALPRAVEKGKEIGCQAIIWRRLSGISTNVGRPIAVVAQQGLGLGPWNDPGAYIKGGQVRSARHQFICAVWTQTTNPGE